MMHPESKQDWSRLLAGRRVQKFCEGNDITNSDELDTWRYENSNEVQNEFSLIVEIFLDEINSEDD